MVRLLNQSPSYQSISALNPQGKNEQNHKICYTKLNVRKSKNRSHLLIYIHAYIINEEQIKDGMLLKVCTGRRLIRYNEAMMIEITFTFSYLCLLAIKISSSFNPLGNLLSY